jgi:predicted lipid-binding transport protein (Tim44 family)
MGEGFVFIEIVIFAMIAAFLVYRLRGVLGRRSGDERPRPNPFATQPAAGLPDNVIALPERTRPAEAAPVPGEPRSLAATLADIRAADPTFDEKHFLQGAAAAFQLIVQAFARGDTAALRPLLSDEVYDGFVGAVRDRQAAGEQMESHIARVRETEVLQASLEDRIASVTIKFVSEQTTVVRGADAEVISGDPAQLVEVTDIWTFARDTRSRDPNWHLVETRTSH